jgi:hypothetical protein
MAEWAGDETLDDEGGQQYRLDMHSSFVGGGPFLGASLAGGGGLGGAASLRE